MNLDELLQKAKQAAIDVDKQYALTPYTVLSALLKAHSVTGGFSSEVIADANKLVRDYFSALTDENQAHIKELKYAEDSACTVIQEEGDRGCPGSVYAAVRRYLFSSVLEELATGKHLSQKDKIKGFLDNNKFDIIVLQSTPKLKHQTPRHQDLFIPLITASPIESYDEVFNYMLSNDPMHEPVDYMQILSTLTLMIQCDCFNIDQIRALSQTLNKHFHHFNLNYSCITWALKTRNLKCIIEALEPMDENQRYDALKNPANYEFFINFIDNNYEGFDKILSLVPKKQMDVLKATDNEGNCTLHKMAFDAQVLKARLALIPYDQRLSLARMVNKQGHNVLHKAVMHQSDALGEVLSLWSDEQKFAAVTAVDTAGKNALHLASPNIQILNTIVSLLPENNTLDAFKIGNENGETIADIAVNQTQSLKDFWSLLPQDQRLNALSIPNSKTGKCIFFQILHKPEALAAIRQTLTTAQQKSLEQLQNLYKNHMLFKNIKTMNDHARYNIGLYGGFYYDAKKTDGTFREIALLANTMETKAIVFFIKSVQKPPENKEIEVFKSEFKALLHSKPELMESHRALWLVIVKNILFSLVTAGLGFIAIAIHAGVNAVSAYSEGRSSTVSDSLFFAQTQRQQNVSSVNEEVDNLETISQVI